MCDKAVDIHPSVLHFVHKCLYLIIFLIDITQKM